MKRDDFTLPLAFANELIIDNFAGGGGTSTGLEAAFSRPVDIAINHDAQALAMHAAIVARWVARKIGTGTDRIVVTDLRDPVEIAALQELGVRFQIVRLHRREVTRLAEDTAGHISQRHRIKADCDGRPTDLAAIHAAQWSKPDRAPYSDGFTYG